MGLSLVAEEIVPAVQEMMRATPQGPHFATFDCDGSIIEGNDITESCLLHMAMHDNHDGLARFQEYHSLLDKHDAVAAYRLGAEILQKIPPAEVETMVYDTIMEQGYTLTTVEFDGRVLPWGINLHPGVRKLFYTFQAMKIKTWIVTASPEVVVRPFMMFFGLKADLIGIKSKVVDGVVTAEPEEPLPIARGKVDCIKKYIHPTARSIAAIGDSRNDIAMLAYALVPIVVERKTDFTRIARERDWFII
jgi:phosphoserine phosphatase